MAISDTSRSLANLKLERDAIVLYDSLAGLEKDPRRAAAFRHIASNERRHAEIWAGKLRDQGVEVPASGGPRPRVRLIISLARLFGTRAVADLVQSLEGDEEQDYESQATPEVESIAADERRHAEIWRELQRDVPADTATAAPAPEAPSADGAHPQPAETVPGGSPRGAVPVDRSPADIFARERWHRTGQTGTLRATIFGVTDGLVANLSLVMGVAGAGPAPHFILLAGIAGLLAGAFSMAAGEWISMQSQRELFERQIALERAELSAIPEEEEAELALVYRRKGFKEEEARSIAHRLMADPKAALDTLIREELGLDPQQLGSPWGAAAGSFLAFSVGAALPVIPYVFLRQVEALWLSLGLSLVGLFIVGVGVSLLTGRSAIFSGLRQAAIGGAAAAITYAMGAFIGVSIGG